MATALQVPARLTRRPIIYTTLPGPDDWRATIRQLQARLCDVAILGAGLDLFAADWVQASDRNQFQLFAEERADGGHRLVSGYVMDDLATTRRIRFEGLSFYIDAAEGLRDAVIDHLIRAGRIGLTRRPQVKS